MIRPFVLVMNLKSVTGAANLTLPDFLEQPFTLKIVSSFFFILLSSPIVYLTPLVRIILLVLKRFLDKALFVAVIISPPSSSVIFP